MSETPDPTTRAEMRDAIKAALKAWAADGVPSPVMPVYLDLDGDGIPDYYGLTPFGELVEVSGADLTDYTSVAELDQPIDAERPI